jgi:hypothetical protein
VLILPAIYLVIAAVLFGDGWSDTVRTMVVTAVISGGLATVVNYFLGSSAGSKASGDVVREIAARK